MSYLVQSTGMGTWKKRVIAKKAKGKQESGRSKGLVSSSLERYICRSNRSWKHGEYDRIMTTVLTGEKRKKGAK